MKILVGCILGFIAGLGATFSYAGPEPMAKEIASTPPPSCDWRGFYIGVNAGGQFGHSEDKDLADYNFPDKPWGYSESSAVAGEEMGYNWQWRCLVFGPEIDAGYMDIDGRRVEPGLPGDTFGHSSSDFYTTLRGRVGVAMNCWLVYATGGAIGVNWTTSVTDNELLPFPGQDTINASKQDFVWGYTIGGGVERMFNFWDKRWSFKVEYLYYNLDSQTFSAVSGNGFGPYGWRADTEGHIVRAGLNFHF
jgi:outer membrane immunogenic protein